MAVTSRGGSTRRWRRLRAFVLRRDGGRCQRCGGKEKLECHHVIPRTAGGLDVPSNCRILCVGNVTTKSMGAEGLTSGTSSGILLGMTSDKVSENRLRRVAHRQGFKLPRSPRRDENASDYGLYALTSHVGLRGTIHEQGPISIFALDLDAVEEYLIERERE